MRLRKDLLRIWRMTMEVDYKQLKPYVITLTRKSPKIKSYKKLIDAGVSGVVVEAGYLYTPEHKHEKVFRNQQAYIQVEQALDSGLPIGWLMYARAKTTAEAYSEMYEFSFEIRKYSPTLGAWLKLELGGKTPDENDSILNVYEQELVKLGLKGKIGIMCTKSTLKTIHWSQKQHEWNLWMIDHVKSASELSTLLNPAFFDIGGKYV